MKIWEKVRTLNRSIQRWLKCIFLLLCVLTFVDIARPFWTHRPVVRRSKSSSTIALSLYDLERTNPQLFDRKPITVTAPIAPAWSKVTTAPAPPYGIVEADDVLVRTSDGRVLPLFPHRKIEIGITTSLEFQSATSLPVSVLIFPMHAPLEWKYKQ